ncbi:MAG: lamin tail domain-containing protein [Bacteroidia bacterium]
MMRKIFTLLLGVVLGFSVNAQTDCSDLFISEYIEGSSNNKGFEIYNPTSSSIDLSAYGVALFSNGGTTASQLLVLSGTLEADSSYKVVNSGSATALKRYADTAHSVTFYNGDDALVLGKYNGTAFDTLDIIGIVGVDPGRNWTVGTGATSEYTLVRKAGVKSGTTNWKKSAAQWDVYAQNTYTYWGAHTSDCHKSQTGGNNNTISIKDLRVNDADGVSTYDGQTVVTGGYVNNAVNFGGGGGMQISIQSQGWAITSYLRSWTGYTPVLGDSIWIYGTIGEFNGLTQFTSADSIIVKSTGASVSAEVVTMLDESTESKLVKIENLTWVDPSQWRTSGSFNIDATNGTDTFTLRVDSDTDIDGRGAQASGFSAIGIGGQYDSSVPKDEGYQLFPREWIDLEFDMYDLSIEQVRENNMNTMSIYDGKKLVTRGVVNNSTNFGGGGGMQISFQDAGWAVTTYLRSWTGYEPRMGDSIAVYGELGAFNGLTQFVSADSIHLLDSGIMVMPEVVTMLDESTESKLVKMEGLTWVDPSQWSNGRSFNIDVTNGVDTFAVRVDSDTDIDERMPQASSFDLIGIGGQYDSSDPRNEGYQLFPRNWWDIEFDQYMLTIEEARENNENGVSLYEDKNIAVGGVVNNDVNFGGSGGMQISFQSNGWGLTTYLRDWTGYQPRIGDSIWIYGELGSFNGLTQFVSADSINLMDSNITVEAIEVSDLNEMTESYLVMFKDVELVDASQWSASGSFNADFTNGVDTFTLRVDSDTDIPGMEAPKYKFDIMGIGGQYDSSEPKDEGYQIFPRSLMDIDAKVNLEETKKTDITVYPTPTSGTLVITSEVKIQRVDVYNLVGVKVKTFTNVQNSIDVSSLRKGVYIIEGLTVEGKTFTNRIVKK